MITFTRRAALATAASFGVSLALGAERRTLRAAAASRGRTYGCEIDSPDARQEAAKVSDDPLFLDAVVRESALLVSGGVMKWRFIEHPEGNLHFDAGDDLISFAASNGLRVRGHTLVWHQNLPGWFPTDPTADRTEHLLRTHISQEVGHWKGKLTSWDVVNEAIEPAAKKPGGLRPSLYYNALGENYIDLAFQLAHDADPDVLLVYNEYGLEYPSDAHEARRRAVIGLLAGLKKRGVPCGALGLQSHLVASAKAAAPFDAKVYRAFLREVAEMGFEILITELDVNDRGISVSDPRRDTLIADEIGRVLDTALDERSVSTVVTWGLSDRYSWLNRIEAQKRADGAGTRGLPLDDKLAPKPIYDRMIKSFASARQR
jgi:endo-1,4-beta-xylanase